MIMMMMVMMVMIMMMIMMIMIMIMMMMIMIMMMVMMMMMMMINCLKQPPKPIILTCMFYLDTQYNTKGTQYKSLESQCQKSTRAAILHITISVLVEVFKCS